MATNNLSSSSSDSSKLTSSSVDATSVATDDSSNVQSLDSLPTDSWKSIGVTLTDAQKAETYGDNGSTENRYAGTNTKSYVDQISSDYDSALNDYNTQADKAYNDSVDAINRDLSRAQTQYDALRSSAASEYSGNIQNREAIEANNGNRDGIGHSQYGAYESAYDSRLGELKVAEQKLIADTKRDLENLRLQGQYEKANASLQLMQAKLQAIYEEQMRIDTNKRSNYEYITGLDQEDKETAAEEDATNLAYIRKIGLTLLQAGVMPDSAMLEKMGLTTELAQSYITNYKLYNSSSGSGSSSSSSSESGTEQAELGENYVAGEGSFADINTAAVEAARSGEFDSAYSIIYKNQNAGNLTAGQVTSITTTIQAMENGNYAYANASEKATARNTGKVASSAAYGKG